MLNLRKQHKRFLDLIKVIVSMTFIMSAMPLPAKAVIKEPSFLSQEERASVIKSLDVNTFVLPQELGVIKYKGKSRSDKVIIHIQDAHCNHAAQNKIAEIIEYFNDHYDVGLINLEGGKGKYDLSIFTDIDDKKVRDNVADYFVKWGEVNGAELFAINNPTKVQLWGVENVDLYIKNLDVYRNSLAYKNEAEQYLSELNYYINNLKIHIFTKELIEFDKKYAQYKTGNIDFKDYIVYVMQKAREEGITLKKFPNIYLLSEAIEQEDKINFRKANNARDSLVNKLHDFLSRNEAEELISKTIAFKNMDLSQSDFYEYLLKKAKETGQRIEDYPELRKYIIYVSLYNAVDKFSIMQEMDDLETQIKDKMYENDKQKELDVLSKNLILMRNMFDIKFTKNDYIYYQKNRSSFDVYKYLSFIEKEAPKYRISVNLSKNIIRLDQYRDEIFAFYDYSFDRDNVFMKNLRFPESRPAIRDSRVTILITGGFHTENLCELFAKKDISYISIIPKFKTPEDYKSQYFNILSGGMSPLESSISEAISLMQIPSLLSNLGIEIDGPERSELFDLSVLALTELHKSGGVPQAFKVSGEKEEYLIFSFNDKGNPTCKIGKSSEEANLVSEISLNISELKPTSLIEGVGTRKSKSRMGKRLRLEGVGTRKSKSRMGKRLRLMLKTQDVKTEDKGTVGSLFNRFSRSNLEMETVATYLDDNGWNLEIINKEYDPRGAEIIMSARTMYMAKKIYNAAKIAPEIIAITILSQIRDELENTGELEAKNKIEDLLEKLGIERGDEEKLERIEAAVYEYESYKKGDENLRDILVKSGRVWVGFADVMGGRQLAECTGEDIMDVLSPEATSVALKFAEDNGVFAYKYGSDEHGFVFPESWNEFDAKTFFIGLKKELAKGSIFEIYAVSHENIKAQEGIKTIVEKIRSENPELKKKIFLNDDSSVFRVSATEEVFKTKQGKILKKIFDRLVKYTGEQGLLDIGGFVMPSGAVRASKNSVGRVTGGEAQNRAEEIAGQKYDEVYLRKIFNKAQKGDNEALSELDSIWRKLLNRPQRDVVIRRAVRKTGRPEFFDKVDKDISIRNEIIVEGLPGLAMDVMKVEGFHDFTKDKEVAVETILEKDTKKSLVEMLDVLKGNLVKNIDEFYPDVKSKGFLDAYTSYSADNLNKLLAGILSMNKAERAKLPMEKKLFMLRGPPADFFIVVIDNNGEVFTINVDMMFSANTKELAAKDKYKGVEEKLETGLSGRETDYVLGKTQRIFPFKALNSYLASHDLADDYILSSSVHLFVNLASEMGSTQNIGDPFSMISQAINNSAITATNDINGVFPSNKEKLNIVFEAHIVPVNEVNSSEILKSSEAYKTAKEVMGRLDAMRSVRDASIVGEDGDVFSVYENGYIEGSKEKTEGVDKEGFRTVISRIRKYEIKQYEKYKEAYDIKRRMDALRAYWEIKDKTDFANASFFVEEERLKFDIEIENMIGNIKNKDRQELVEYLSSKNNRHFVVTHLEDIIEKEEMSTAEESMVLRLLQFFSVRNIQNIDLYEKDMLKVRQIKLLADNYGLAPSTEKLEGKFKDIAVELKDAGRLHTYSHFFHPFNLLLKKAARKVNSTTGEDTVAEDPPLYEGERNYYVEELFLAIEESGLKDVIIEENTINGQIRVLMEILKDFEFEKDVLLSQYVTNLVIDSLGKTVKAKEVNTFDLDSFYDIAMSGKGTIEDVEEAIKQLDGSIGKIIKALYGSEGSKDIVGVIFDIAPSIKVYNEIVDFLNMIKLWQNEGIADIDKTVTVSRLMQSFQKQDKTHDVVNAESERKPSEMLSSESAASLSSKELAISSGDLINLIDNLIDNAINTAHTRKIKPKLIFDVRGGSLGEMEGITLEFADNSGGMDLEILNKIEAVLALNRLDLKQAILAIQNSKNVFIDKDSNKIFISDYASGFSEEKYYKITGRGIPIIAEIIKSYAIMEEQEQPIKVINRPGEGTTFVIHIPYQSSLGKIDMKFKEEKRSPEEKDFAKAIRSMPKIEQGKEERTGDSGLIGKWEVEGVDGRKEIAVDIKTEETQDGKLKLSYTSSNGKTEEIQVNIVDGSNRQKVLLLEDINTFLTKEGTLKEKIGEVLIGERLTREEKKEVERLLNQARDKISQGSIKIIEDHEIIKGVFGTNGTVYLNSALLNNSMAFIHEMIHGSSGLQDMYKGVNSHNIGRGGGEAERTAVWNMNLSMPKDEAALETMIDRVDEYMQRRMNKTLTESVKNLMRYNFNRAVIKKSRGEDVEKYGLEVLLFGVQDHLDAGRNAQLTNEIQQMTGNVKKIGTNIVYNQSFNDETESMQHKWAQKTKRKYRKKWGINVEYNSFGPEKTAEEILKEISEKKLGKKNEKKYGKAMVMINCIDAETLGTLGDLLKTTYKDIADRVVLINNTSILRDNQTHSESIPRLIHLANQLLNFERLRVIKDFKIPEEELVIMGREMLSHLNRSNYFPAGVFDNNIFESEESFWEFLNEIKRGERRFAITPINWTEIQDYNDSMEAVYTSL